METSVKTPNDCYKKILHFVMIFNVGLPSLNAFFSGPKSPNDKVSVLIRKRITCRFQKSSYFWFLSHFCWSYSCLKHRGVFFGTPKKNAPMFQTAITPTKMAQKSKVRWLLESACNSLSDEHWNFFIWTLGAWEKCI